MPMFRLGLLITTALSLFIRPCLAITSATAGEDGTKQPPSISIKTNESQKTSSASKQALSTTGSDWFAHATLSYEQWQQGNILSAMHEGEEAVRLNPNSAIAVINLALMKQREHVYPEAISLYWQAAHILPDSWVPPLGIARCYILSEDKSNGSEILHMMSEQNDRDFDWYYGTAKTWLEFDDPSMAAQTARRAMGVAMLPGQKAAAENLQFLALLRAGKTEQAKSLQQEVFHDNSPRNPELFVRAALTLLPDNDPVAGRELLKQAMQNLPEASDSEAFLKLGAIFKEKADGSKIDPACRPLWLENAQSAYSQALAMRADLPDYHFALAGVYSSEGNSAKAAQELKVFSSLDRHDILAPFVISKLLASQTTVNAFDPVTTPVNLALVKVKINGLNCSCKLGKIHEVVRQVPGVAFISTPPQKPFSALIMIDQSLTPTRELLAKCNSSALLPETDTKGVKVSLEMTSAEPVNSINDALSIASKIRLGPILSFRKTYSDYMGRFQEIFPIKPVNNLRTANGVETASTWNEPL